MEKSELRLAGLHVKAKFITSFHKLGNEDRQLLLTAQRQVCIILVFALMLWRIIHIAQNAPDLFGTMLAAGVFAHVAVQVVLNIAVVTNFIPNTGVSLPFISYGGTASFFLLLEMGIVLNISSKIRLER